MAKQRYIAKIEIERLDDGKYHLVFTIGNHSGNGRSEKYSYSDMEELFNFASILKERMTAHEESIEPETKQTR